MKVLAIGVTVGGVTLATVHEKVDAAEWTPRTVEQIKADLKGNEYTIVWGDTLSGISQATNISVQKLADMNKIANVDLIYAGNKLVFDGNVATVQNSAGETVAQTVIQDTDKVNPTQPVGQPAVSQDTTSNATNSADQSVAPTTPAGDSGANTPEQPVQPSTPSDNGNQGGTVTPTPDQNQGGNNNQDNQGNNNGNNNNGNNNGGNEGGDVTPPQPVEKWTVWYSASDEANAAHNIEKGTKVFDTEAEATAWIDQYADGLLAQGITSNSYGVSSFLVQE